MTYGIISDTHLHNWSAFSATTEEGVNSRLQVILDEIWRAAVEVSNQGGRWLVHGGDLWHSRGVIVPSVLNPAFKLFERIREELGVYIVMVPGNHDMEGNDSGWLTNATTAMGRASAWIADEPGELQAKGIHVYLAPWHSKVSDLKKALEETDNRENMDLIIHAPVDGVIAGLPEHGLTHEYLGGLGFRNVFSGHYHHHRDFGNGVYSIGATTHQTWNDVGAKAGFLIVDDDGGVTHHESMAPKFVDLSDVDNEEELRTRAEGNYVRMRFEFEKNAEVQELRDMLLNEAGAAGAVITPLKKSREVTREASVEAGASISRSVQDYIGAQEFEAPGALSKLCEEIMNTEASE